MPRSLFALDLFEAEANRPFPLILLVPTPIVASLHFLPRPSFSKDGLMPLARYGATLLVVDDVL